MGRLSTAAAAAMFLGAACAARADDVALDTGEILHGTIASRGDDAVVLEHPVLGTLRIPRARVAFVVTDAERAAAEAAAAARPASTPAEFEAAAPAPAGDAAAPAWKSRLELGVNGSAGNTRSRNWIAGVVGERASDEGTWRLDARYSLAESAGETTQNRFTSGLRRDWAIDGAGWSLFAEARYDRDQFQEWSQRAVLSAGASRKLIDGEDFDLAFRAGAAGTREWGSGEDRVRPEGLAGIEGRWAVDASKTLEFGSTWYPDLSDAPEFRTLSTVALAIRLDEKGTMNLRLGLDHEYDTHRSAPFDRTDIRYFALLVMEF